MGDTKKSRNKQARNEEKRQREREITEARDRDDETEPVDDRVDVETEPTDSPGECHRRDCTEQAAFVVFERYQEETGHGAVEATADLCQEHTAEESPVNLDGAYGDYLFRVEPLSTQH